MLQKIVGTNINCNDSGLPQQQGKKNTSVIRVVYIDLSDYKKGGLERSNLKREAEKNFN